MRFFKKYKFPNSPTLQHIQPFYGVKLLLSVFLLTVLVVRIRIKDEWYGSKYIKYTIQLTYWHFLRKKTLVTKPQEPNFAIGGKKYHLSNSLETLMNEYTLQNSARYTHSAIFRQSALSINGGGGLCNASVTASCFHRWPPLSRLWLICMVAARSVLRFPPNSSLPAVCEAAPARARNFWYTLEVAGEFRPAAPLPASAQKWRRCSESFRPPHG